MQETARKATFRDECGRISEVLDQGHRLLDDLIGSEAPRQREDPASPHGVDGTVHELEVALAWIEERARNLALRLEALCKQI